MAAEILVFAGSGSTRLTAGICRVLGQAPARGETIVFSDGNLFVRVLENVRARHVFIVQGTCFPTNDNFMELLFWIDAMKRASAGEVTAVIPFFSYAKGDKKDEPRVSIRGRVCADALEAAGVDRVVTMDLHAPQVQGFFRVPVDHLYALPSFCEYVGKLKLPNLMIASPDEGYVRMARKYASILGTEMAVGDKYRAGHNEQAEVRGILGNVEGRTVLIVDDFALTGGSLAAMARALIDHGAREVYAAVSHGLLTKGATEKIEASPLKQLIVTDSVENRPEKLSPKIKVVSVAPLFAEAIRRIYYHESISALFPP
ncbi:MAG TPA: ribose-phosphate pyrophosphokinase [Planctomycetota bacterium]|nr:ribose-phosphate pyrophosphokinase [Planctomycetota bacterium]